MKVDAFICHASPDKDDFVRPFADALRDLGIRVWYDEFSLEIGDSISEKIAYGIANARFGIVIISKAFVRRSWPRHELQGLIQRDVEEDLKILPIWHGVSKREVMKVNPSLADKLAINTLETDIQDAAITILRMVRRDLYEKRPRTEHERIVSGEAIADLRTQVERLREEIAEYQCPYCEAPLSTRSCVPCDPDQQHWDDLETYECGLELLAREIQHPCPSDPEFPSLSDYDLVCKQTSESSLGEWRCDAWPKTSMARKVDLDTSYGRSKDEALHKLKATYLYRAGRMTNKDWFQVQTSVASPKSEKPFCE